MAREPISLQAESADLELKLRSHEHVPDWQETHAMSLCTRPQSQLGKCIRTDLGVRTFQGLGKNSPSCEQVVRRITRDLHTHRLIESLDCEIQPHVPLHRRCHL